MTNTNTTTSNQTFLIAIFPKIPAILSLLGSSIIIQEVMLDRLASNRSPDRVADGEGDSKRHTSRHTSNTKRSLTFACLQRLLLAMSCYDLFSSIVFFLSTWVMPRNNEQNGDGGGGDGAIFGFYGNQATCNLVGFSYQFGLMGTYLSNSSLALFSFLIVKYTWRRDNMHKLKRLEKIVHTTIFVVAFGVAIVCLPLNLYNPAWSTCHIQASPTGCQESWKRRRQDDSDKDVDSVDNFVACERGDNAFLYSLAFNVIPLWICICISSVIMYMIYRHVKQIEKITDKYRTSSYHEQNVSSQSAFHVVQGQQQEQQQQQPKQQQHSGSCSGSGGGESNHNSSKGSSSIGQQQQGRKKKSSTLYRRHASKVVGHQSIFYISAFLLTYLPVTIAFLYFMETTKFSVPLHYLVNWFLPLQGFFNYIVFANQRKEMKSYIGATIRKWWRSILWKVCYCSGGSSNNNLRNSKSSSSHKILSSGNHYSNGNDDNNKNGSNSNSNNKNSGGAGGGKTASKNNCGVGKDDNEEDHHLIIRISDLPDISSMAGGISSYVEEEGHHQSNNNNSAEKTIIAAEIAPPPSLAAIQSMNCGSCKSEESSSSEESSRTEVCRDDDDDEEEEDLNSYFDDSTTMLQNSITRHTELVKEDMKNRNNHFQKLIAEWDNFSHPRMLKTSNKTTQHEQERRAGHHVATTAIAATSRHDSSTIEDRKTHYLTALWDDDSSRDGGDLEETSFTVPMKTNNNGQTASVVVGENSLDKNTGSSSVVMVDKINRWYILEGHKIHDIPSFLREYGVFCYQNLDIPIDKLSIEVLLPSSSELQKDNSMYAKSYSTCIWIWEVGKQQVFSTVKEYQHQHHAISSNEFIGEQRRMTNTQLSSAEPRPFHILMTKRDLAYRLRGKTSSTDKTPTGYGWSKEVEQYQDYIALPILDSPMPSPVSQVGGIGGGVDHGGKFKGIISWCTKSTKGFSIADSQVFVETVSGSLSTVLRLHINEKVTQHIMKTMQDEVTQLQQTRHLEMLQTEEKLKEAKGHIVSTESSRSQQLHRLARLLRYEIRTPINEILKRTNSSLLQQRQTHPTNGNNKSSAARPIEQFVSDINDTCDNVLLKRVDGALEYVEDILKYNSLLASGADGGNNIKDTVLLDSTTLHECIGPVLQTYTAKANDAGTVIRVHTELPTKELLEQLPIQTDVSKVREIVRRLLDNALEATQQRQRRRQRGVVSVPEGNQNNVIDVTLKILRPDDFNEHQSKQTQPETQIIQISVKDYGKGIAKSSIPNLLDPYNMVVDQEDESAAISGSSCTSSEYSSDATSAEANDGVVAIKSGLGLAIVSKLVNVLGGMIIIDSQLEEWCELVVILPLQQVNDTTSALDSTARKSGIKNATSSFKEDDGNKSLTAGVIEKGIDDLTTKAVHCLTLNSEAESSLMSSITFQH